MSTTSLLFLVLFSQCSDPAQSNQSPVYYDVAGFVKSQIADLSANKPLVQKQVALGNRLNGEPVQATRDIDWSKELELFMQADINKPALRSSYQITRPDPLTYQYTLKPSEERLTVRSLRVRLDSLNRQPSTIEAVLQTSNPLYTSERKLSMSAGMTQQRQWQIKRYQVNGYQKLTFFDRKNFFVAGYIATRTGDLSSGRSR